MGWQPGPRYPRVDCFSLQWGNRVSPSNQLLGVVDINELLLAEPTARLHDLMVDNVISLQADSMLKEASDMFARYSFRAIPVVDAADKILGVVTYRDIRNLKHRFLE